MKKIAVGQTLSLLANVGVIAGIVFLAIEIRDNSTQARINTTQESVAQRTGWRELIASDDVLSDLYVRGLEDYEQLSLIERERFSLLMQSFLFKMSISISARDESLVGLNPDAAIETRSIEGDLLRMLDKAGFRQWWTSTDLRGIPGPVFRMTEQLAEGRFTNDIDSE